MARKRIKRPQPRRATKATIAEAARTLRIAARFLESQRDEMVYDGAECDHFCIAEECRVLAGTLDGQDPVLEDGCVCVSPEPDEDKENCTYCGGELADIPDEDEEEDE